MRGGGVRGDIYTHVGYNDRVVIPAMGLLTPLTPFLFSWRPPPPSSPPGTPDLFVLTLHNGTEGLLVHLRSVPTTSSIERNHTLLLPGLYWPQQCGHQRCNILTIPHRDETVVLLPARNVTGSGGVVSLKLLDSNVLEFVGYSFVSPSFNCQPLSHFYGGEEKDYIILSLCLSTYLHEHDLHVLRFGINETLHKVNLSTAHFLAKRHSENPLPILDVERLSRFLYWNGGCGETKTRLFCAEQNPTTSIPTTNVFTYRAEPNGGNFAEASEEVVGCIYRRVELYNSPDPGVLVHCSNRSSTYLTACVSSMSPQHYTSSGTGELFSCSNNQQVLLKGNSVTIQSPTGDNVTFDIPFFPADAYCVGLNGGEASLLLLHPNGTVMAASFNRGMLAVTPLAVCGEDTNCFPPVQLPGYSTGIIGLTVGGSEVVVADLSCPPNPLLAHIILPSLAAHVTFLSIGQLHPRQCPGGVTPSETPSHSTSADEMTSAPSDLPSHSGSRMHGAIAVVVVVVPIGIIIVVVAI